MNEDRQFLLTMHENGEVTMHGYSKIESEKAWVIQVFRSDGVELLHRLFHAMNMDQAIEYAISSVPKKELKLPNLVINRIEVQVQEVEISMPKQRWVVRDGITIKDF